MALKMDRQIDAGELGFFINETAERGNIVSISTAGSGIALDNVNNVCTVAAAASGQKPLGMLLDDVVNVDQSRQSVNWHKMQAQIGSKASVATKGWFVTNRITGTPTAGQLAVLGPSGTVSGVALGTAASAAAPIVGSFRSSKNEDGYAKVYIDL
jgi:hypothetical protein